MKQFIYFLVIFFTTFAIYAQSEAGDPPFEYPFQAYEEQYCATLNAITTAVVRYESTATCYFELAPYFELGNRDLVVVSNNQTYTTISTKGERSFLLEGLPLNRDFMVQYVDGCGKTANLNSFTTSAQDHTEGILVSNQLMAMMSDYYKATVFALPEYLESESTLNYYEKLSFWQDIAFNDRPLADGLHYAEFLLENAAMSGGGTCNCLLLLTKPLFAPGTDNNIEPPSAIPVPEGDVAVYSGHIGTHKFSETAPWKIDDPNDGGFYRSLWSKGAARRQVNRSNGWTIHTRISDLNTSASSMNYSQIQVSWYCFTGWFHFTDCGCRKTVDYKAKYNRHYEQKFCIIRAPDLPLW